MAHPDINGEQNTDYALNDECPMGYFKLFLKVLLGLVTEFGQNLELIVCIFDWLILFLVFLAHRILIII